MVFVTLAPRSVRNVMSPRSYVVSRYKTKQTIKKSNCVLIGYARKLYHNVCLI